MFLKFQENLGNKPEPETGTVGTVFLETQRSRGIGPVGTVFQEPKPEPSLSAKIALIGHFLRGRLLKGRCNICVYVPVCVCVCVPVCVCVCVCSCVCVPPLPPPRPHPYCGAEQQNPPPQPHMTSHPRSRIRTRMQLRDLPLGRTTRTGATLMFSELSHACVTGSPLTYTRLRRHLEEASCP